MCMKRGYASTMRRNISIIVSDQHEEFVKPIQERKLPGSHFITFYENKLFLSKKVSEKCNANIYLENVLHIFKVRLCKRHRTHVRIRS